MAATEPLEINANCGIYYPSDEPGSADQCLAYDPAGHEAFTRQLVAAALKRHRGHARSRGYSGGSS